MDKLDFVQDINKHGGQVYLVGGAIRDKLVNKYHNLGIIIKDYDLLVTGLEINSLEKVLHRHGKLKQVGKAFGIIIFNYGDRRFNDFDIALPRKEISTGPGYRDFDVITDHTISLKEDLSRRDATINTIAYKLGSVEEMLLDNIEDNKIIDYFGGIDDIKKKVWRAVGDPKQRFIEDPTRILRCLRQTTNLGLTVNPITLASLLHQCDLLKNIISTGCVRLTNEMVKMLNGEFIDDWIRFILTKRIGPLLDLNYTKNQIVKVCSAIDYAVKNNFTLESKVAILLNPLGELATVWINKFELSATNKFNKENIPIIMAMSKYYNKLIEIEKMSDSDTNKIISFRKWIVSVDSLTDARATAPISIYLLEVLESFIGNKIPQMHKLYNENKDIITDVRDIDISGKTLLQMGFKGKKIGDIKNDIFKKIISKKLINNKTILINYVKHAFDVNC